MTYMLCRNRVEDFAKWIEVFLSHAESQRAAGLKLVKFWQSVEDSNNVFFLFEVESIDRAKAFIQNLEAAAAGKASGVIDGEYHFLEEPDWY